MNIPFFPQQLLKRKLNAEDENIIQNFKQYFKEVQQASFSSLDRPTVIICIGTDRCTGDCLGPLVGEQLQMAYLPNTFIYGNLDYPVHAVNLEEITTKVHTTFQNPNIIAVDACLGSSDMVGSIFIKQGPLKPGSGVKKELPPVGNMHITGVVNISGFLEHMVLQNTRLSLVRQISNIVSQGIYHSLHPKPTHLPSQLLWPPSLQTGTTKQP